LLGRHTTGVFRFGGVKPVTQMLAVVTDKGPTGCGTDGSAAAQFTGFGRWVNALARVSVERSFPSTLARSVRLRSSWSRAEHCLLQQLGIG